MFKLKYLSVTLFVAILAGVVFVSCSDGKDADPRAEGLKAGREMCAEAARYDAPSLPQHPESPRPPASFDPNLDYSNPDVVDNMELDAYIYFMNPAIQNYYTELADFQAAFNTYAMNLSNAMGVIAPYEKYVVPSTYDPTATTDKLLTAFEFLNDDFKEGFKEGVGSCADAFESLLNMSGQ